MSWHEFYDMPAGWCREVTAAREADEARSARTASGGYDGDVNKWTGGKD